MTVSFIGGGSRRKPPICRKSAPITSKIVSSNPVHGKVNSIQRYVIKFVSDMSVVFSRFSVYLHHDITEILLKVTLNTINQPTINFTKMLLFLYFRELQEECGLYSNILEKIGLLKFEFIGDPQILEVHVFTTNQFTGTVQESSGNIENTQWYNQHKVSIYL